MSQLGISTVWCSKAQTAEQLLAPLRELEVDGLEIEYRVPESTFRELVPLLRKDNIQVLSLHNYCPHPERYRNMASRGDLFSLSSLDKDERAQAVKWTSRTLEWAEELQARAVVLHLGEVDLGKEENPRDLYKKVRHSIIGEHALNTIINRHLAIRYERANKYLDAVFFSLDRLDREAERRGILLGIENRYFYHQIPNCEEIGAILKRFGSSRYWHDVGHGNSQEQLGIHPHLEPLKIYRSHLLGVHLHDAVGLEDHMGLGEGNINFEEIGQLLPPEALRILELRPETTLSHVQESIRYVRKYL